MPVLAALSTTWLFVMMYEISELLLYIEPDPLPLPLPLTEDILIDTTAGDTSWAILFIFAPVAPISTALLPFGQFPLVER